ncbi:glutamate-5-semialdehyde dehydrogenase [Hellea balneolensis]|uniref:glutamate-5-semialdehyde dehydrogenase n=1 Tax=Hellea balneolensis TaxID=287478 RepID=UPI00041D48DC|nr:glutamate-5-semialdehyde dehydrogenase [Hellea balneolensis]
MHTQTQTPENDLTAYMEQLGHNAREAAASLRLASTDQKTQALKNMAAEIRMAQSDILGANTQDMEAAERKGISGSFLDRLKLNESRIEAMAIGLEEIAALPDPVGSVDETWTQPNGLKFSKVRVPIGVIGMIYESRPNVTADAGALCVKSGNACILRGGSESAQSSRAIHLALIKGLDAAGLPATAIQLIATTDRAAVGHLLGGLNGSVDLIIPRGGKSLISRVQSDARIPVLAHLEGLCHTYIHQGADLQKAEAIILNAKLRRTGVCGSTETMLLDGAIASTALPKLAGALLKKGCELRGDKASQLLHPEIKPAADNDYFTEHLAPVLNIRIVKNIDMALTHIAHYGSGHTDSIVTEDKDAAARFLKDVDSAICMHNTSTQFADGGQFGFGAEIGIATGRLHARGPVGAQHLTTYKYCVEGDGQVRPL